MNTQILKCLVQLTNYQVDTVIPKDLYEKFPNSPKTREELDLLSRLGYITILYGDNGIDDIGVNKKAIDYFK
ncbi:UNVERIFIED_CONTAM: hypothetical protein C7383_11556 [Murimonas intestini]|uniref:Uncharacterized protein n=1 Tax=Murimonas intestini TaxID=1337051 RepID=A0AB73SZR7_9FIRM